MTTNPAHVAFGLGSGPIGFREGADAPSLTEVHAVIAKARASELARYAPYGELADVKEALQAATMWNYI